jgi:hypothetical protein
VIPYITYREPDSEGKLQYYILQKRFPHFVGKIIETPKISLVLVPIAGYSLYVCWAGTLMGNLIPNHRNIEEEIKDSFVKMAEWFYQERILTEPKKYKKWLLKQDSTT